MKPVAVKVQARDKKGGREGIKIRREGYIPSVAYSRGNESISIMVHGSDFIKLASTARGSQVFAFESSDAKLNGKQALVRDIQRDFQKDKILHIDFQMLNAGEAVKLRIPLRITGDALGVKNDGGVLEVSDRFIMVRCMPNSIPSEIGVDVSELNLGHGYKAKDIKLPEGVTLAADPHESIVSVVASRTSQMLTQALEAAAAATAPAAAAPGAAEGAAATPGATAEGAAAAPAADAKKAEAAPAKK